MLITVQCLMSFLRLSVYCITTFWYIIRFSLIISIMDSGNVEIRPQEPQLIYNDAPFRLLCLYGGEVIQSWTGAHAATNDSVQILPSLETIFGDTCQNKKWFQNAYSLFKTKCKGIMQPIIIVGLYILTGCSQNVSFH